MLQDIAACLLVAGMAIGALSYLLGEQPFIPTLVSCTMMGSAVGIYLYLGAIYFLTANFT